MDYKIVYAFDPVSRVFTGPVTLDASDRNPLVPGEFIAPGNTLSVQPPPHKDGHYIREYAGGWQQLPAAPAPEPEVPGAPPPSPIGPPNTLEVRSAVMRDEVQKWLDGTAQAYGYDDIKTAVTYAEEPAVPRFQLEGRAFRTWRSLVWDKCYQLLAAVAAGAIEEPTLEQLLPMLPVFDYESIRVALGEASVPDPAMVAAAEAEQAGAAEPTAE